MSHHWLILVSPLNKMFYKVLPLVLPKLNNMTKYQLMLLFLSLTSIFLLTGACSDKTADPFASASMVDQLQDSQRLFQQNRSVPTDKEQFPSFNLIYEGDVEQLMADEAALDQLMKKHSLIVTHSFEIDEDYKGLTLQASTSLKDAIKVAKSLSLLNQVMMVEASPSKQEPVEEYM